MCRTTTGKKFHIDCCFINWRRNMLPIGNSWLVTFLFIVFCLSLVMLTNVYHARKPNTLMIKVSQYSTLLQLPTTILRIICQTYRTCTEVAEWLNISCLTSHPPPPCPGNDTGIYFLLWQACALVMMMSMKMMRRMMMPMTRRMMLQTQITMNFDLSLG